MARHESRIAVLSLLVQQKQQATLPIAEKEVEELYNSLGPVKPELLIGEWNGGTFDTGHAGVARMADMKWAGKTFRGVDDGIPIMVIDGDGNRVQDKEWGGSSLREVVFRGVTSTAMIYDQRPIIDHFRYVSEDVVVGAMDCPKVEAMQPGTFYFFLTRRKS